MIPVLYTIPLGLRHIPSAPSASRKRRAGPTIRTPTAPGMETPLCPASTHSDLACHRSKAEDYRIPNSPRQIHPPLHAAAPPLRERSLVTHPHNESAKYTPPRPYTPHRIKTSCREQGSAVSGGWELSNMGNPLSKSPLQALYTHGPRTYAYTAPTTPQSSRRHVIVNNNLRPR